MTQTGRNHSDFVGDDFNQTGPNRSRDKQRNPVYCLDLHLLGSMFVSGRLKADFSESEMDELMSAVISEVRDTEMLLLKPTQKN